MSSSQDKPTYWELLQHPKWQEKRLNVLSRQNFTCEQCGSEDKTLHVHHTYYERGLKPWEYPMESLHCLCEDCHKDAQDKLTLLHRAIGKIDTALIDMLYGYALGLISGVDRDAPLDVYSFEVAVGLGNAWGGLKPNLIIGATQDGVIDGNTLERMAEDSTNRRRE